MAPPASTPVKPSGLPDQWRICFIWTKEGPANVKIVDYH